MQHKCRVEVIGKKCFNDYQEKYLADPNSGECPFYNVGDVFMFERYSEHDDFWTMGKGSQCSEAWDCISRYIYTALQGGSIMRNWTNDERMMIACCNDGTRPVIFKIERIDYKALYIDGIKNESDSTRIKNALMNVSGVREVNVRDEFIEAILDDKNVTDESLREAAERSGEFKVIRIE